jgi:hypothetical protein
MALRATLVLAAVMAALVLPVQACWACSCVAATPEEYWEWSSVVFDGNPTDRSDPDENGMVTWTFEVVDAWKGTEEQMIQVSSHTDSATCGFGFELGTTYRVFASNGSDGLTTGLCSGTAPRDTFDGPPAEAGSGSSGNEDPDSPDAPDPTGDPTDPATPVTPVEPVTPEPDPATDQPTTEATPLVGAPVGEVEIDAGDDGSRVLPLVLVGAGGGLLGLAAFFIRRSRA